MGQPDAMASSVPRASSEPNAGHPVDSLAGQPVGPDAEPHAGQPAAPHLSPQPTSAAGPDADLDVDLDAAQQGMAAAPAMLGVSVVIQHLAGPEEGMPADGAEPGGKQGGAPVYTLSRSSHRVPAGTTIRQLLQRLEAQGHAGLIAELDARTRGLSRHGRRAWLDDALLQDDRLDLMLPILADAKKARFERVAAKRERKWRMPPKR